jgi:hypothetical protein
LEAEPAVSVTELAIKPDASSTAAADMTQLVSVTLPLASVELGPENAPLFEDEYVTE